MAWNQPGGSGDRDPWGGGRGSGQQGPPDLDEVLRKLQAGLSRIFGAGKAGGGGTSGGGGGVLFAAGKKGIAFIALLVFVVWIIAGIYIVDPPEQGVVLRFGQYNRTSTPGPNWRPYFIESVEKINVQQVRSEDIGFRRTPAGQSSVSHESLILTEDEAIVDLKFTVQYRVSDPGAFLFNVVDPTTTLRQATESAVREIVGKSKMDFVLTEGRDAVASEALTLIQSITDSYGAGLTVTSVNMQSAQPPREVQDAFFDAVKAREDEERTKNQARAYAADVLPRARGDANAVRERALAYQQRVVAVAEGETDRFLDVMREYNKAPAVTRERLYLEAMESVLSNSSKVMIDVEGGNSLIYLPLDKLMGAREKEQPERVMSTTESTAPTRDRRSLEDTGRERFNIQGRTR
ncbi:MAG: FtsH protease activity modulator HflK [Gammaproteobacteria bacterium]